MGASGNGGCPPTRPKVVLHVKPRKENGTTEWSVGFDEDPSNGHKAEVYLAKGSGAHDIVFHLVGTGPDVRFDLDDPIWVKEGRDCPDSPSCSDQIEVLSDESTDRKLVVHDRNDGHGRILTYSLNFVGADRCDPMIRNGGEI